MERKLSRKEIYNINKAAKVKDILTCPICHTVFIKKQWQQAFCCSSCKDKFWNAKGDRHSDPDYYHNYNMKHLERLERIGIYDSGDGKLGHYDEDGNFWTFEEEADFFAMCEDPIMGV